MTTPYTQENVDHLYRLIGKAVWHLQHLENVVASFTAFKILQTQRDKGKRLLQSDVESVLGKQRGQTLGPLIGTAKANKTIPKRLIDRFDVLLKDRNWLIHRCGTEEFLSLRNDRERQRLYQRLDDFSEETIELHEEIHSLFEGWFTELGYNLEESYTLAEDMLHKAEQD